VRGQAAPIGSTTIAANGYHYTKVEGRWRLTHHIVAEKEILKRPLTDTERVMFVTSDKLNLKPENIKVVQKGKQSLRRRKAQLEARIEELQAELAHIEASLTR
jgi:hypothetical protein